MAIGGWVLAALCAGALGWIGRPVLVLLPDSDDAGPETPSNRVISRAPRLGWWLAGSATVLITVVALSVPLELLPAWILVCGVGVWLSYIDWRTQLLPTRIIAPLWTTTLMVIALEAWIVSDRWILLRAVACSALAYGFFWLFWWIATRKRPGSFGFGDVRFSAVLGLALGSVGVYAALSGLYLGFVVGAVVGIALRVRGHAGGFAFGPPMLAGAVLGLVFT
jgi:leader peptidase (prepilin peptidase)/N-methyltransferase